ncbi:histidine phosphatase family protein [Lentilactobacillus raoultii]|uniref:Histidine phosphatase family protein n=1 Tax=Lentilactobacillus raoultii TaxID=1987503 RepID=A0ABW3PE01_9LACO|nr:histidine phosphatase family protein [Lentilactobacillus raoultii]
MKLFVLRHGETLLNRQRKFYGSLNVSLDKKGFQQADEVAKKLTPYTFSRIIISDMLRTKQTAVPILNQNPTIHPIIDARFNEMGFGDWEGLNANEIQALDPIGWQKWLNEPFKVAPGNGEGYICFKHRVLEAFQDYYQDDRTGCQTLLIAHLGVLRALHHVWFPNLNYWNTNFLAGDYSVYTINNEGVQLTSYNV